MQIAVQFFIGCLLFFGLVVLSALEILIGVVTYYEIKKLIRGYRNN